MINLTKKVISQALDCVQQATLIVNARKSDLPIAYVNPAFEVLVGSDATELIGVSLRDLVSDGELPEPGAVTFSSTSTGQSLPNAAERLSQTWNLKDGQTRTVSVKASALYDRPGNPAYWMLSQIPGLGNESGDSESQELLQDALTDARRRLKNLERSDPATGVPNRAEFLDVIQRDWSIARREQRCLGLIIFEVDAFAEYRNLFGRHAADSVLRKIAHAINGSLRRAGDFSARYDEARFAALVGSANEIQAQGLAESIASKVRNLSIHHPHSPLGKFLTLSFGVASEIPGWDATSSSLIARAEEQQVLNRPQPEDDEESQTGEAAAV
jgi:diguanylate cyclase (GGDEF)-like protein/PAS domain S-box-containing protein